MERNIFLGVVLLTIVLLALAFILPSSAPKGPVYLPWQIETTATGTSKVFGLELGQSTLRDAEQRFQEPYEVSMFVRDGGARVVEAYFDSIALSGIRAKVVLVIGLTAEQLTGFYERGVRIATLGGGNRKVTLADADMEALASLPIATLTYIPKADLSAELIEARFGRPAERIREQAGEGGVEHWLYPQQGLDVALHDKGKEVLQYVPPANFDALRAPLLERGEVVRN